MSRLASMSLACALCAAAVVGTLSAKDEKGGAKVGQKAPDFQATDDQGNTWKSSDHVGKKIIVLYFFPADFTGGCTAQACGFRDNMKDLTDKNVEVVAVSGDTVPTHAAFKKTHNLPFTLLADENGAVAKTFGVPFRPGKGKANYKGQIFEREGTVTTRTTVIIGLDGTVAANYPVRDAAGDSKKALQIVQKLEAK